ncbi:unnamed protein product [Rhizophagus irregularis]|nr:unnamed protein product [Rhizophagus irregularis]
MEFKLELLEQHISELEAENTELNDENTKLRQVIEENAIRRGTRTKEQKNTELEARIALLEQDQLDNEAGRALSNNANTESLEEKE